MTKNPKKQPDNADAASLHGVVMRLSELAKSWDDKALATEREWYNESSAYRECAYQLEELVKSISEVDCG